MIGLDFDTKSIKVCCAEVANWQKFASILHTPNPNEPSEHDATNIQKSVRGHHDEFLLLYSPKVGSVAYGGEARAVLTC